MKLIKAPHRYEHPYGDVIYGDREIGDYTDYIRKYDPVEVQELNILQLAYIQQDTWKALFSVNIAAGFSIKVMSKYTCGYTGYEHFALVPLAIFSDNVEKYFEDYNPKPWYYEMACDKTWNWKENGSHLKGFGSRNSLTEFQRVIIGPGYTYSINDGSSSVNPVIIDIDNGDKLGCAALVWHNK